LAVGPGGTRSRTASLRNLADEVLAAYPRILPTAYAQFLDGGKAAGPPHDGDTCRWL
jgi:hypothetical protein